MKITKALLRRKGACSNQLALFIETFPNGVKVTKAACIKVADKFCWNWAAANLLPRSLWLAYDAKRAPFRNAYDFKCAALYAVYKAKRAPLAAAYEAKRAALLAAATKLNVDYDAIAALYADYEAKRTPIAADYAAKRAPIAADYDAKCASLFGRLAETAPNERRRIALVVMEV